MRNSDRIMTAIAKWDARLAAVPCATYRALDEVAALAHAGFSVFALREHKSSNIVYVETVERYQVYPSHLVPDDHLPTATRRYVVLDTVARSYVLQTDDSKRAAEYAHHLNRC